MDATYTSYELTVTTLKSWQSWIRSVNTGGPPGAARLWAQESGAAVVDSEPEVVVASAVVVASELAMELTTSVLSVAAAEDVASLMEVST